MLSVEFDYAQPRLKSDMLSMLASGPDWLPVPIHSVSYNAPAVWIEPVSQTVMLMPGPLYPSWTHKTDSIYTKYRLADLTDLTNSSSWREVVADEGGPFLQYVSATGNPGSLSGFTPTQIANQAMVVEWHQPNFTFENAVVMECGWSDSGNGETGVSLRISAGGKVEVWKDDGIQGTYSLSIGQQGSSTFNGLPSSPARGYVSVMLIPYRDRELLVYCSTGGAFSHLFPDLVEGEAGQTITSATKFWFNIPAPQTQSIRLAKIQFASSGSVWSRPSAWRFPPPALAPQFDVHQSLSQADAGLLTPTVVNSSINPSGLAEPKQIRVDLAGGPDQTPFLYGVRAWYPPVLAHTVEPEGGPADGSDDLLGCTLSVADSVSGAEVRLLMKPSVSVPNLRKRMGRTVRISDSEGALLRGMAEAPTWSDAFSEECEDVDLVIRDAWKQADEYVFADPIPLDGMNLSDAYTLVAEACGCSANVSADGDAVKIGSSGSASGGDWECLIEVGERASTWLLRLHSTYAATWAHFVDRDGSFVLWSPDEMPSAPAFTLYRSVEDAVEAGVPSQEAWKHVYRSAHRTLLEPEANEIWVMGRDARSQRPILVAKRDLASADPSLSEADKPDNWLGRLRKFAYGDPALTSKDACLQALDLLYARLTAGRVLVDVECEYLEGQWKGDLISLVGAGYEGEEVVGRIKAFQGSFQRTEDGAEWRPFQYVLEVGSLVAPLGDHGFTAPSIKAHRRARLAAVQKRFDGKLGHSLKGAPQFVQLS